MSVALLLAALGAKAMDPIMIGFQSGDPHEVSLLVGQSQIINSSVPIEQAVIGSPETADIKLLTAQRVLVLGIKPGSTNLMVREKGSEHVAVLNVTVSYDRNGIKRKIFESMPSESSIEVRDSNDKVILGGVAGSASTMEMALAIARSFVPSDNVVNLMQVAGGQQVMLEAKVSEVSHSALKNLGVQTSLVNPGKLQIISGQALQNTFGSILATGGGSTSLAFEIDALEQKGLAKALAEPNLVALSGQEANFLAGGEIPIPVAQVGGVGLGSTITITYKEFGVGLRFTPTVLDKDRISLKLLSEVSAIDPTNSFNVGNGITVPSLTTRRAGTTIMLGDGQSFAIAGLLQDNMQNAIQQFPILGSIPVLGALFRSTNFQKNESELIVIVTAHLVKPVDKPDSLAMPTDVVLPPSNIDQYLLGHMEGSAPRRNTNMQPAQGGGMDGSYGHQLN